MNQDSITEFAKELFAESFHDIERLLPVFKNGQIEERQFAKPIEWFKEDRSFEEKNDTYITLGTEYGAEVIKKCLTNDEFLLNEVDVTAIDAIILVSSSGMSTPSLDARIMNVLPFSPYTKRIPLWGLGCAGGAAGMSRAYEFCRAYPDANVLVVCIELCSLTFQRNDLSKSNLVGMSLFSDGVACALVVGEESSLLNLAKKSVCPVIEATQSTLMPNSEDVMGWDVKDSGLHVVFSRNIPSIIKNWLRPNVETFLQKNQLALHDVTSFIAHPGGKKVLDAYADALHFNDDMLFVAHNVLKKHGNMSSPTILYVLEQFMKQDHSEEDYGLMASLGPGFCSELVLVKWKGVMN